MEQVPAHISDDDPQESGDTITILGVVFGAVDKGKGNCEENCEVIPETRCVEQFFFIILCLLTSLALAVLAIKCIS